MRTIAPILALLAAAVCASGGVESLSQRSPFIPPSGAQASGPGDALSGIELTGIFSLNGKPKFSVRDTATGRSVWVGLNETEEGLTILSYDEAGASVVIEGRGASRRVKIRDATVQSAPPPPPMLTANVKPAGPPPQVVAPAPVVAQPARYKPKPPPKDPKVEAQERDARLLVSDLLEISIQERKRYEENQRRAAAGKPRLAPNEPLPDAP